jgi:hypothetical protein
VNISGGQFKDYLMVLDNSKVTIYGYDFQVSGGATIAGNKVIGSGVLRGKWFDGTSWTILISNNTTTASVLISGEIPPEDPYCGDYKHPYPSMDFNKDCRVNLADFALFAAHWMECTAPECD